MSIYDKVFPPRVLTLPNGNQAAKPRSRAPLAAAVLLAMTALSVEVTGFDMRVLISRINEFFVIQRKCSHRTGGICPRFGHLCLIP